MLVGDTEGQDVGTKGNSISWNLVSSLANTGPKGLDWQLSIACARKDCSLLVYLFCCSHTGSFL